MATIKETHKNLLVEGLNLSRKIKLVSDIPKLDELKNEYTSWLKRIKEFIGLLSELDYRVESLFYENDLVMQHGMKGGLGVTLEGERAQEALSAIEIEVSKKLSALREIKENELMTPKELFFDRSSGVLHLNKNRIEISKSRNSNQYWLLRILIEDKERRIWSMDELVDKIEGKDVDFDKKKGKSFYYASRDVNEKIAMETNTKNFLKYTTKDVQINPEYL